MLCSCKYNCGPPQPEANGFRANKHAAWQCKPCYNSAKALAIACRNSREARDGLAKLQAEDHEQWASMVRSCRIATTPGETGVGRAARKAKVHEMVKEVAQFVTVKTVGGTKWLTRSAWAKYMVKHYDLDYEAQLKKFDEMANDPTKTKMKVAGDQIRLPVMKAPETVVEHGRTVGVSVSSSSRVNSVNEMKAAMTDMANIGRDASAMSTADFGETAAVFRPGAIDGHQSGQPVPFEGFKTPAPIAAVADEAEFEGLMKRHQCTEAELAQAEQQPAKKRRTTTGKARPGLGAVTGQLLDLRTEGYERLDNLLANYSKAKANTAKKVKDKFAKGPANEKVNKLVNQYEVAVQEANNLKESVQTWTVFNGKDKLLQVHKLEDELANLQTELLQVLEEKAAQFRALRKANLEKLSEANKVKRSTLKAFEKWGHSRLANWLYGQKALVATVTPIEANQCYRQGHGRS